MARLKSWLLPGLLLAGAGGQAVHGMASGQTSAAGGEFALAGACARCHVGVVLEWGFSAHQRAGKSCVACHGSSDGHVENERNDVKPDRVPRKDAIAGLCRSCHGKGCPRTQSVASCQTCHHVHALVKPQTGEAGVLAGQEKRLAPALQQLEKYRSAMSTGEAAVAAGQWKEGRAAFERALELRPSDRAARRRVDFTRRRLNPALAGFRATGEEFDPETGLPLEVIVEGLDLPMVLIRSGRFDLGDERYPASRPVHAVDIEPFYLGQFEVTQGQWSQVMGSNPSRHQGSPFPEAGKMPVEQVSWYDCVSFVEKLNARVRGGGFRLPTEAEWEYGSRAAAPEPDRSARELESVAWFGDDSSGNSGGSAERSGAARYFPHAVGTKTPNAWRLFDMLGNVWEWCSSAYRPYPYSARDGREEPVVGPSGSASPELRVLRGGSFADPASLVRATLRFGDRPGRAFPWVGIRLARTVPPIE